MKISGLTFLRGAAWTIGAFGVGQALRLLTNVALARLLAPELFGVMIIINSVRTGIDLLSDVGIGQSIVQNKNAQEPEFYNTAWTIRLVRGFLLWLASAIVAFPLAHFYQMPDLIIYLPVAGLFFALGGLSSMGVPLLQKRMQVAKLNAFEVSLELLSSAAHVILAYLNPTIWALLIGGVVATAGRTVGSYFVMPGLRHRLRVSREYAWQILAFGKWIFVSSMVYFLAMNFDRLYLGKVAPLELLGVYGIARTLSDVVNFLSLRLCYYLVFPTVSASSDVPREQLHARLAPIRLVFLLAAAFGLSCFVATADFMIQFLYDQRYQAAAWMLPVLFSGSWFSILSSVNESALMGLGKPSYAAAANGLRLGFILVALPLGFTQYGALGAILAFAACDLCRYGPIFLGQRRERFSFGVQDALATLVLVALIGFWQWLRWRAGLGTSFDHLPIPWSS